MCNLDIAPYQMKGRARGVEDLATVVDRAADLGDDGMQLGERADETGELRHRTAGPAQRRLCEVRRPLGRCNVEQLLRIKRSAECGLLQHGADVHGIAETDIRAARLEPHRFGQEALPLEGFIEVAGGSQLSARSRPPERRSGVRGG